MYCKQCGVKVSRQDSICPNCGVSLREEDARISDDVRDNRSITLLSYLGPLAFVPYFAAKRSPFARFHSLRGVNLFLLEIAFLLLSNIVYLVSSKILIALGFLVNIANAACWAFLIFVSICGILNVCKGKKSELPYLSWIRNLRIIKR